MTGFQGRNLFIFSQASGGDGGIAWPAVKTRLTGFGSQKCEHRANGYNPRAIIEGSRELSQALSAIASGVFSPDDPDRYAGLIGGIYDHDWFMVAADFEAYAAAQRDVDRRWNDKPGWRAAAINNVARVGWFSSDRTIREYAKDIWGLV